MFTNIKRVEGQLLSFDGVDYLRLGPGCWYIKNIFGDYALVDLDVSTFTQKDLDAKYAETLFPNKVGR
jgi:hypothetical protein